MQNTKLCPSGQATRNTALTQIIPVILEEDLLTKPAYVPTVSHECQCLPSITGTRQYQPALLRTAFLQLLTLNKERIFHLPCEVPWWTNSVDWLDSSQAPLHFLHCSVSSTCGTESCRELFSLAEQRWLGRDGNAHFWPISSQMCASFTSRDKGLGLSWGWFCSITGVTELRRVKLLSQYTTGGSGGMWNVKQQRIYLQQRGFYFGLVFLLLFCGFFLMY